MTSVPRLASKVKQLGQSSYVKQFKIYDPIDSYFECITTCDIGDGRCISKCVEILKQNDN
mgnify:CR=1 FL=1